MNREVHVRFWESAGLRCPAPLDSAWPRTRAGSHSGGRSSFSYAVFSIKVESPSLSMHHHDNHNRIGTGYING
jgi:hypothetical protein